MSEIIGQTFDRLTVIRFVGLKMRRRHWECRCSCGNLVEVTAWRLRSGLKRSCGCLPKELGRARSTKHGMCNTRPYHIWEGMMGRCSNPGHAKYEIYGHRGIRVCERWHKFKNWWDDMRDGYDQSLTIDRINNDGDYEPGNCRWATYSEQNLNRKFKRTPAANLNLEATK